MRASQSDIQGRLLQDLSQIAPGGHAEETDWSEDADFFAKHLPVQRHDRWMLDPGIILVLGGRGSGKTQLFQLLLRLRDPSGLSPGTSARHRVRIVPGFTTFGDRFPQRDVVVDFLKASADDDRALRAAWVGFMAGALLQGEPAVGPAVVGTLGSRLAGLLTSALPRLELWLPEVRERYQDVCYSLDEAHRVLQQRAAHVILTYDDLDVLARRTHAVGRFVKELLGIWLDRSRRWDHIRAKVFLRNDIFDPEQFAFSDSSKLRAKAVALSWDGELLYRLVLKRLLNGPEAATWRAWLGDDLSQGVVRNEIPWGVVPHTREDHHRAFMARLIGPWMGADKRRGDSYRWFLNHLQDAHGEIAPRSFLMLFRAAAERQMRGSRYPPDDPDRLLSPQEVQGALEGVSQSRIAELAEEFPWVDSLREPLAGTAVPVKRSDLRKLLRDVRWEGRAIPPPDPEPDGVIQTLLGIGVLRTTDDGRLHVPYIYLYGFRLKLKGGIQRPR